MNLQIVSVIGADPGPTTGLAFLDYINHQLAAKTLIQVDGASAVLVLEAMLSRYYSNQGVVVARFAGIENFVTGRSAGTKGHDADVTRQLVMEITEKLQLWGYSTQIRKASDVKPWSTDRRLAAAGVVGPSSGMRHALDGARHALYAATRDAHLPDPLR